MGADVRNLRNRERGVVHLQTRRALLDVNQAILIAIHQRAQQHASQNAENGRVRANAERQRQGYRHPQRRGPSHRTQGYS